LQNCIERAVILAEGDALHARHLNLRSRRHPRHCRPSTSPWDAIDLSGTLADVLRACAGGGRAPQDQAGAPRGGGDRERAAHVPYKLLLQKIKDYGIALD
jgi:DNA-binding NtrC family response regulator